MNNQTQKPSPSPNQLEIRYRNARLNLLGAILFTVVNMVLAFVGSATYFLFSVAIPYNLSAEAANILKFPTEYFAETPELVEYAVPFATVFLVIAVVILAFYLLAFLLSKKPSPAWMTVSLCLFSIDTVLMLALNFYNIIDLAFHVWVIYYLIVGLKTAKQLKNLPAVSAEAAAPADASFNPDDPFAGTYDDQTAVSTEAKSEADQNTDPFNSGF